MSYSWLANNFLALLLMPPANGLLLAVCGACLCWRGRRWGAWLLAGGLALLWLLSLHVVAALLAWPLERLQAPLSLAAVPADAAIVVLGGGRNLSAPEFAGDDDLSRHTLQRLRYGAQLSRQTARPLLVTGGNPDARGSSEAELMQRTLARDFALQARWSESASRTTRENARLSAPLLQADGIRSIVLVTHAAHMPRAVREFQAAGLQVVAAPLGYVSARPLIPLDFLPRGEAMAESSRILHEWVGLLAYALSR